MGLLLGGGGCLFSIMKESNQWLYKLYCKSYTPQDACFRFFLSYTDNKVLMDKYSRTPGHVNSCCLLVTSCVLACQLQSETSFFFFFFQIYCLSVTASAKHTLSNQMRNHTKGQIVEL